MMHEIVPLPASFHNPDLYGLVPETRIAFPYRFAHSDSQRVRWCQSNFGSSALMGLPSNLGGGEGIFLGGRWVAWGYAIYIADPTDATAFRLVFG